MRVLGDLADHELAIGLGHPVARLDLAVDVDLALEAGLERRFRAFAQAVGNIVGAGGADGFEKAQDQRAGGRAIDIVIAEYGYLFTRLNSFGHTRSRKVHILESGRVGQRIAQCRVQETLDVFGCDAARGKYTGQNFGDFELLGQCQRRPIVLEAGPPALAGDRALDREKSARACVAGRHLSAPCR